MDDTFDQIGRLVCNLVVTIGARNESLEVQELLGTVRMIYSKQGKRHRMDHLHTELPDISPASVLAALGELHRQVREEATDG